MNDTITAIPGIEVGHWTDTDNMTGCTVVVLPEPNVVAGDARGGAPGTREFALLQPGMRVEQAQALLLTGGSAFGLAAADGVMRGLEADGRGHETPVGRVPIVPAAVIFDLFPDFGVRPGPEEGERAYRAASSDPVEIGLVGAGTGATVAKWRGLEHRRPGGLGSASVMAGDVTVGVLVVINAVGDVFTLEGESLTGGDPVPGPPAVTPEAFTNTTLVVAATDARLSRLELSRLLVRAHDALAACIRPVHTRFDGDMAFGVSAGQTDADVEVLSEAAFVATARAIEKAVRASNGSTAS
ncbi:MAG TPA: P1 family peptidase [Acidimicrobiia bacterium]|nr:P1 family peptidase [Acidimicrobiia bacterium]